MTFTGMDKIPRFRLALHPTDKLHVTTLHAMLFSWAWSRSLDGDLILRIEDLDGARISAEKQLIEALRWLNLDWDEGPYLDGEVGPYRQSQRTKQHQTVIQQLASSDALYEANGVTYLQLPKSAPIVFEDVLRGKQIFEPKDLNDPVIIERNGQMSQLLASVVDDHLMEVTHVVGGNHQLVSAPLEIAIYNALGWQQPIRAYLPPIVDANQRPIDYRSRTGGYLLRNFQQDGYLPQAVWSHLLLLGWTPPIEPTALTKWTVRKQFRLDAVSSSNQRFDRDKLRVLNRHYLRKLSICDLAAQLRDFLEDAYGALPASDQWLHDLTSASRDELVVLEDVVESAEWAFETPSLTSEARQLLKSSKIRPIFTHLLADIASVVLLDQSTANSILKSVYERAGQSHDSEKFDQFIRAALIGRPNGPDVSKLFGILGKQRSLERIGAALTR